MRISCCARKFSDMVGVPRYSFAFQKRGAKQLSIGDSVWLCPSKCGYVGLLLRMDVFEAGGRGGSSARLRRPDDLFEASSSSPVAIARIWDALQSSRQQMFVVNTYKLFWPDSVTTADAYFDSKLMEVACCVCCLIHVCSM